MSRYFGAKVLTETLTCLTICVLLYSSASAAPEESQTQSELLRQSLEQTFQKRSDLAKENSRRLREIQLDATEQVTAIYAERLSATEHKARMSQHNAEKQKRINEVNDWYRASLKAIDDERLQTRQAILARFASGDSVAPIAIDGALDNAPADGTASEEIANAALADIIVSGIGYEYAQHINSLPTHPDQAPPLNQDRTVIAHRCTTQVTFVFHYSIDNPTEEPISFDLRASINGREIATTNATLDHSTRRSFRSRVTLPIGEHVILVMADTANDILERTENNNRLFSRIAVVPHSALELNCEDTSTAATTGELTDPRATGQAADISGALDTSPASTPDDAVLNDVLTQPDLAVSLAQPMNRTVTIANQGHSATTANATLLITCETILDGPCPASLISQEVSVPPLGVGEVHEHELSGWPRSWDWPRGDYQFTAMINADRAVIESAANNTDAASYQWRPSMMQVVERCMRCHIPDDSGQGPSPDDLAAREAERGFDAMVSSAIGGVRLMPARGDINWLSDAEVAQAVRSLIDLGDPSALANDGFYSDAIASRPRTPAQDDALDAASAPLVKHTPRTPQLNFPSPNPQEGDALERDTQEPDTPQTAQPLADEPLLPEPSVVEGTVPQANRARGTDPLPQHGSSIGQHHVSRYNELLANIQRAKEESTRRESVAGSFGDPIFGTDCDDDNPAVHPHAAEIVCDTIDNDCDGTINEGAPLQYIDADEDGWGDGTQPPVPHCATIGFSARQGDCNDRDFNIRPDAPELPDNQIDENCNGSLEN